MIKAATAKKLTLKKIRDNDRIKKKQQLELARKIKKEFDVFDLNKMFSDIDRTIVNAANMGYDYIKIVPRIDIPSHFCYVKIPYIEQFYVSGTDSVDSKYFLEEHLDYLKDTNPVLYKLTKRYIGLGYYCSLMVNGSYSKFGSDDKHVIVITWATT